MSVPSKIEISIISTLKQPRFNGGVPRFVVFYTTHDGPSHMLSWIDLVGHSYDHVLLLWLKAAGKGLK